MARLRLDAVLGLNKTGFDAGIAAATKQVMQFGAGIKNHLAGLLSVGGIINFGKSLIETGSEIKDLSDRLGVLPRDVQEFGIAARLGGQDADVFAKAIEKIRMAMAKGDNPLEIFGITVEDMKSGDAVGVLRKLAVAMKDFSGDANQTKAMADAFGTRGMGGVINMLRELPATGVVLFSDKAVKNLDTAGDLFTKLWHSFKALAAMHPSIGSIGLLFPGGKSGGKAPPVEGLEEQERAQEVARKAHMSTMDRINSLEKDTNAINERNRISKLTDEERINELMKHRLVLIENLRTEEADEAGVFGEGAMMMKHRLAEVNAELGGLQNKKSKSGGRFSIEESGLGRIGAFSGGSAQAGLAGGQQAMLAKLTQIHIQLAAKGIIVKDTK